jgi:hypothetical protein
MATTEVLPAPVAVLDMCCGGKKCPQVETFADGSMVTIDGETGEKVPFTAEQRERLRAFLNEHA